MNEDTAPAPRIDEEDIATIRALIEASSAAPAEISAFEHGSPEEAGAFFARSVAISGDSRRLIAITTKEPNSKGHRVALAILGNGPKAMDNARLFVNARESLSALLDEREDLLQEIESLRSELARKGKRR